MSEKEKVYCEDCAHRGTSYNNWGGMIPVCIHPDNCDGSFYSRTAKPRKLPSELNEKNDCSWFEAGPRRISL